MRNDIERCVDTVLSGLTTTPERKAELIQAAMREPTRLPQGESCPRKAPGRVSPASRVKLRFSLSFGLSHMIVAAVVIIVVLIAPLFIPGQKDFLHSWQSRDGDYYMIEGKDKSPDHQVAEADTRPPEPGVFSPATPEEAKKHYGSGLPLLSWLPEDAAAPEITVSVTEVTRGYFAMYQRTEGVIIYQATEFYDPSSAYTYISQDGAGEYVALASGTQAYLTTNGGYMTLAWQEELTEFLLSGSFTREEAIRMAESIKTE